MISQMLSQNESSQEFVKQQSTLEKKIENSKNTIRNKPNRHELNSRIVGTRNKAGRRSLRKQQDIVIKNTYSRSVLRDIQRCQQSHESMMVPLFFRRLVQEVGQQIDRNLYLRFQLNGLIALQEHVEGYFAHLFHHTTKSWAIHGRRIPLMPKDIELIKNLRRNVEKKKIKKKT